jgi:hypothetical protein
MAPIEPVEADRGYFVHAHDWRSTTAPIRSSGTSVSTA